jgi:membrane-associated phospholipid phosphatase
MVYVWDLISIAAVGFYVYPFLRYLDTQDARYISFAIGVFVLTASGKGIKALTSDLGILFKRPKGALNCDTFCKNGDVSGRNGFPSGHVATTSFFFAILWMMETDQRRKQYISIVSALAILLMMLARTQKKCHNWFQSVAGLAYGIVFAMVWHYLFMNPK